MKMKIYKVKIRVGKGLNPSIIYLRCEAFNHFQAKETAEFHIDMVLKKEGVVLSTEDITNGTK